MLTRNVPIPSSSSPSTTSSSSSVMVKETTSLFILVVVGSLVGNDVVTGCRVGITVGLCVGDAVIGGRVLDKVGNSVVVFEMGSSDGVL